MWSCRTEWRAVRHVSIIISIRELASAGDHYARSRPWTAAAECIIQLINKWHHLTFALYIPAPESIKLWILYVQVFQKRQQFVKESKPWNSLYTYTIITKGYIKSHYSDFFLSLKPFGCNILMKFAYYPVFTAW